jgi:lipopolysaccharide transport system permease protein
MVTDPADQSLMTPTERVRGRPAMSNVAPCHIEPPKTWASLQLRELWSYRELLYFLAWRDVKVRYKQTLLGAAWAVLQPLLTMVAFSLIFGRLLGVPSNGQPYPIFSYSALLPWTFFATAVTQAGLSLVNSANLVSKIYFPRLIVPAAAVLASGIDFAISFVILLAMLPFFDVAFRPQLLLLPLLVLFVAAAAVAVALWLSALHVKYRDVGAAIPFLMQFWLFVTPVVYPASVIPERWRLVYALNPMTGVVEAFRWAVTGGEPATGSTIAVSATVVLVVLIGGLFYFRRAEEQEFADVI